MKASELVKALQASIDKNGDIDVLFSVNGEDYAIDHFETCGTWVFTDGNTHYEDAIFLYPYIPEKEKEKQQ